VTHDDCRICDVVRDPLPHDREPSIDWLANHAYALADRRLDRDVRETVDSCTDDRPSRTTASARPGIQRAGISVAM
jgi:hypothetical protein